MEVADAMTFHYGRHVNHCRRDWRCGDRNLRGNYRSRQWTARFNALFLRYFSDNWQRCQRDVASARKDGQEIGHDRCEDRDVFRVTAQQLFCLVNQIVQTASNLHGRNSSDNRHDNGNYIERNVTVLDADSGKNQHPNPPAKPIPIPPNLAPKKIASKTMMSSTTSILAFLVF